MDYRITGIQLFKINFDEKPRGWQLDLLDYSGLQFIIRLPEIQTRLLVF
jgi:hypothetical protein